jgi:hypothetical protein
MGRNIMHLINSNNGKPFAHSQRTAPTVLEPDEKKRRHYAAIKIHAEALLKTCHTDVELRSAIVNLYHMKLREHQVEVTAHPENSVNYLLASLEVFQVCLHHIFMAIQAQEQNPDINTNDNDNPNAKDENANGSETES